MKNQTSSKNIILNYGLILGVLSLLPSLIKYAMGNYLEQDWISGTLGIVLSIVIIFFGIKKFKEINNGFLSWGQGLKIGVGITFISLLITIIYLLLFSTFIEPEFKKQVVEHTQKQWASAGMSDEMIEKQLPYVRDYFYLSLYGGVVMFGLFIGFIISAIVGAIMKKSKEEQY